MKVLNLRCTDDHRFEGWFASEADFQSQDERGLLTCPMCGNAGVSRLPSAPRLNVSRNRDGVEGGAGSGGEVRPRAEQVAPLPSLPNPAHPHQVGIQSQMLRAVRQLIASTEDVGARFPEEARRIHYGESEERGIRGRATREEAAALADEGIEVMALPMPEAFKGETH